MSDIPFSSAAASATDHACSRHAHILGPRFCAECRAPLCTACVRMRAHRTCPSCNVAAGRKASVYDVGWFAVLFVDGLVHALSTVKRVLLPFAIVASMLALAGVVGLFGAFGDSLLGGDADAVAGVAIGALTLVVLGGLWLQPGLSVPTVNRVDALRRSLRGVVGAALPGLVSLGAMSVGVGLIIAGEELDNALLTVLGTIVGGGTLFASFALSSLVLPIQAAYAVGGRSVLGALQTPFRGGVAAIAMFTVTWLMILSMLYSGLYLLLVPVMVISVFLGVPVLAGAAGAMAAAVGLVITLLVMGAYGSASLRICEDRATLRS